MTADHTRPDDKPNILIVDDQPANLVAMRHLLEDFDANLIEATSGTEALSLTLRHDFALALLDVQMPDMDGFETAELMRGNEKTQNIPIIFVTAIYQEEAHVFRGYETGAVDLLLKPIAPFILQSKIKVFLQLDHQRRLLLDTNAQLEQRVNERTKALRELNETLEQRVNDRTQALTQSLEDLKQAQEELIRTEKMAALGHLVAGVAHEINTPIGISITGTSHLQDNIADITKKAESGQITRGDLQQFLEEADQACQVMLSQLRNAATLVSDFKQIAVDQSNPDIRPIQLHTYLDKVITTLKPQLKRAAITVDINVPAEVELSTCPGALAQALTALISNCLIHAFDGKNDGAIHLNAQTNNNGCTITLQDNGKGIAPEHLSKIFEPFFTTRRGDGGSGLGLSIVHNIVSDVLKGSIQCDSTPGKGTTFTLNIPSLNVN